MKKRIVLLICTFALLFIGCASSRVYLSEADLISSLQEKVGDGYGELKGVTIGKTQEGYTVTEYRITPAVMIDCEKDPTTENLREVRLRLLANQKVNESEATFSYFALYLIKVHDPDIDLTQLNEIYDTLNLSDVTPGQNNEIKNRSTKYAYTVTEEEATFTATYFEIQQ